MNVFPSTCQLANSPLNLLGFWWNERLDKNVNDYSPCFFSPLFALKSFKFRIVFCVVFNKKTMKKYKIHGIFVLLLVNILQINRLQRSFTVQNGIINAKSAPCNLLICKILNANPITFRRKMQKWMKNYIRFYTRFQRAFIPNLRISLFKF